MIMPDESSSHKHSGVHTSNIENQAENKIGKLQ